MADAPPAPDILVLVAHPSLAASRANRRLKKAARQSGPRVMVRDLYRLYPDYLIDVKAEQAALEQARLVVWQHPIHWYGAPPLMKLWFDDVLTFGWAYGPGGRALRGKDVWLVVTTGGSQDSYRPNRYNRYFFDAFLPPYEQTAVLCGMRFLPPLVLHGAHRVADAELAAHADVYADRLQNYPDWPEVDEMGKCPESEVPGDERPVEEEQVA
jgi:glutathione-regulated potassium-efflux system ancillary protein KefF